MSTTTESLRKVLPSCSSCGSSLCRISPFWWAWLLLMAASFARTAPAASPGSGDTARLLAQIEPRFKTIYERDEFAIRSFTATWLPDGSGYLKLETPVLT
ncbi:MAG: hypothetical protein ACYC0X_31605 [Pirellulaceae bacterium]